MELKLERSGQEVRAFLRDTITTIIIAVVIIFGLQAVVQKFVVNGPSMNFTFQDGQHILANKIVYKFREPQRGEVVIFHSPNYQKTEYIKRIIGLPGESVEIKEGVVYIQKEDGTVLPLDEPYITEPARLSFKGGIIQENSYFVLGDNRNNSSDSRNGWTLPRQNIIGKAWVSIWPPDKWGLVVNYLSNE